MPNVEPAVIALYLYEQLQPFVIAIILVRIRMRPIGVDVVDQVVVHTRALPRLGYPPSL